MATERHLIKKRNLVISTAIIVLAFIVISGMFVVTDIIQELRPSNVRFDETITGELYSRVPLNYTNPIDDLLVVKSSDNGKNISIRCYAVLQGFNVVDLLINTGIQYDVFTYSVYGIVFKSSNPSTNISPVYRFLFQNNTISKDSFFMSREVIPIYNYVNAGNFSVQVVNEGFFVSDVTDKINDILRLPFM